MLPIAQLADKDAGKWPEVTWTGLFELALQCTKWVFLAIGAVQYSIVCHPPECLPSPLAMTTGGKHAPIS
jgi:hypothetical protein